MTWYFNLFLMGLCFVLFIWVGAGAEIVYCFLSRHVPVKFSRVFCASVAVLDKSMSAPSPHR